uniref:Uncharacterized protein n=1 Tax=Triticum urartu TaxID=4572 RepID=A0A8R7P6D7_TRIUA
MGRWRCCGSGSRTRRSSSSGRRRSRAPPSRSPATAPSPTSSSRAAGSWCPPPARAPRSSASCSEHEEISTPYAAVALSILGVARFLGYKGVIFGCILVLVHFPK